VKANDATMTYDGMAYDGAGGVSYTSQPNASLLGSVTFGGVSQNPLHAGSYTLTPGGLYSAQHGYIVTYASGTLTVNRASVNMSGERVFDATTRFTASSFGSNGSIGTGVGTETLILNGTGTVASANAGVQVLNLGTLALADGSGLASNYTFTGGTHTGRISAPEGELTLANGASRLGMAIMSGGDIARIQNPVASEISLSAYGESDGENKGVNVVPSVLGNTAELNLTVVGAGIKSPPGVLANNGEDPEIR
jgi:hypothetical protein